ncbi:unnamed protein product [Soboliphyme baturini]|uniref:Uncharacterized protein n=1 Tax=Soboliphyme baturini TaxID=241478 RepID=A0A183IGX4_9BILA|nr:unnamed protein product [Soboliphyme baturini]
MLRAHPPRNGCIILSTRLAEEQGFIISLNPAEWWSVNHSTCGARLIVCSVCFWRCPVDQQQSQQQLSQNSAPDRQAIRLPPTLESFSRVPPALRRHVRQTADRRKRMRTGRVTSLVSLIGIGIGIDSASVFTVFDQNTNCRHEDVRS